MSELQDRVEASNKDRIRRFEKGKSVIQTIHDALPLEERGAFSEYRERWQATDRERLDQPFPLNVYLDINTACNLKCIFCTRGHAEQWREVAPAYFGNQRMGYQRFQSIIDECADHGLQGLWFGGGETLLEKEIEKMVAYARGKGITDVTIVTNGHLLSQERILRLIEIPLTRISISLDAFTEETYERLRGGDYHKVKGNVERLLAMREDLGAALPIVRVSFVEHPENLHELHDFVAYWQERVDVVDLQKLQQFDRTKIVQRENRVIRCTFPWRSVMIMSNGDVMPCCSLMVTSENTMGNVYDRPLKEIWDSERFKEFRLNMKNGVYTETCKTCYDSIEGIR